MKEKNYPLSFALSEIDDELIEETLTSTPTVVPRVKTSRKLIFRIALIACLLIALMLPIAINSFGDDSIEQYADSPYYEVIKAIHRYHTTFAIKRYYYTGEVIETTEADPFTEPTVEPELTIPEGWESDAEGANRGASGVLNGALLQKSETAAFYLVPESGKVAIYSLEKEESKLLSTFAIEFDDSLRASINEIYLINDNKTLVAISKCWDTECGMDVTAIVTYDVSALDHCFKIAEIVLEGHLTSSHYLKGKMLIRVNYRLREEPNYDSENFVPCYRKGGERYRIAPEDITATSLPSDATYNILYQLDETLTVTGAHAVLGRSTAEFVTGDTYYLVSELYEPLEKDGEPILFEDRYRMGSALSTVVAIGYTENGLVKKGSVTLKGSIGADSMLEGESSLLVATTTRQTRHYDNGEYIQTVWWKEGCNVNLYAVSLDGYGIEASRENLASGGETVAALREDASGLYIDTANYAETAFTYATYRIDLADSDQPSVKCETFAPLPSVTLGEYRVVIKEEGYPPPICLMLYREGEDTPIFTYQKERIAYYHSDRDLLVDVENGYLGMIVSDTISDYQSEVQYYLLQVKDDAITLVKAFTYPKNTMSETRAAFVKDGCLYLFWGVLKGDNPYFMTIDLTK